METTYVSLGSQGLEEAARNIPDALPKGPDRKRRRRWRGWAGVPMNTIPGSLPASLLP